MELVVVVVRDMAGSGMRGVGAARHVAARSGVRLWATFVSAWTFPSEEGSWTETGRHLGAGRLSTPAPAKAVPPLGGTESWAGAVRVTGARSGVGWTSVPVPPLTGTEAWAGAVRRLGIHLDVGWLSIPAPAKGLPPLGGTEGWAGAVPRIALGASSGVGWPSTPAPAKPLPPLSETGSGAGTGSRVGACLGAVWRSIPLPPSTFPSGKEGGMRAERDLRLGWPPTPVPAKPLPPLGGTDVWVGKELRTGARRGVA